MEQIWKYVDDIKERMRLLPSCRIEYAKREANFVAHVLAKLAVKCVFGLKKFQTVFMILLSGSKLPWLINDFIDEA